MKGFIIKDLQLVKNNLKTIFISLILYAVIMVNSEMDISSIMPFISVVLMITTFLMMSLINGMFML